MKASTIKNLEVGETLLKDGKVWMRMKDDLYFRMEDMFVCIDDSIGEDVGRTKHFSKFVTEWDD